MLIAIVLGAGLLASMAFLSSRTRLGPVPVCPSCSARFVPLPQGERPAYDVLVCPQCANTLTAVHGGPSRFARCPACSQRTLEIGVTRLPPTRESPIGVECHEACHVCNYTHTHCLPEAQPRGQVIPFPRSR